MIAPGLGCPTSQWFAEQVAAGLTHGVMPSSYPSGSWGLHPNTPDGRKRLSKKTAAAQLFQPFLRIAVETQVTFENFFHPGGTNVKRLSGSRAGRHITLSPNIFLRKHPGWMESLSFEKRNTSFHLHPDIGMWMMNNCVLALKSRAWQKELLLLLSNCTRPSEIGCLTPG